MNVPPFVATQLDIKARQLTAKNSHGLLLQSLVDVGDDTQTGSGNIGDSLRFQGGDDLGGRQSFANHVHDVIEGITDLTLGEFEFLG